MPTQANGTILITGGTGFAGSHLIEYLVSLEPSAASRIHTTSFTTVPDYLSQLLPAENFHQLNLTDAVATSDLITQLQPTQLYHLAALSAVGSSFETSKETLLNNIGLQLTILQAVQEHSPHTRILTIGSADGYGVSQSESEIPITEDHPFRPVNPYAVSKVSQELLAYAYIKSFSLDIVRVRPFNHIGERQSTEFAVPSFAKQIVAIERGEQHALKVGSLEAVRDFTDVKDMVRAYHILMNQGSAGEVYNVGTGVGRSMTEVVDILCQLSTASIKLELEKSRIRALDIPVFIANNEKIRRLGWQPEIELKQSLHRILEFWRTQ